MNILFSLLTLVLYIRQNSVTDTVLKYMHIASNANTYAICIIGKNKYNFKTNTYNNHMVLNTHIKLSLNRKHPKLYVRHPQYLHVLLVTRKICILQIEILKK